MKEYNQGRVSSATHRVENQNKEVVFLGSEIDCIAKRNTRVRNEQRKFYVYAPAVRVEVVSA